MVTLPGANMTRIQPLAGSWTFTEEESLDARDASRGTAVIVPGPAGLSLVCDEIGNTAVGAFRVHGILAWEASLGRYAWVLADSRVPGLRMLSGIWDEPELRFFSALEPRADDPWRNVRISMIEATAFHMAVEGTTRGRPFRLIRRYERKLDASRMRVIPRD